MVNLFQDKTLTFGQQKNTISTRGLSNIVLLCGLLTVYLLPADFLFNNSTTYCLHKTLFHFDCPGCGMTRALHSFLHGHFRQAISYNFGIIPLTLFLGLNLCNNLIAEHHYRTIIKYTSLIFLATLLIQYLLKTINIFL